LVRARMNVRPKPRQSFLFGDSHAAHCVILFKDEHLESRPRQVAATREAIVPCADNDRVIICGMAR